MGFLFCGFKNIRWHAGVSFSRRTLLYGVNHLNIAKSRRLYSSPNIIRVIKLNRDE